jgi:hypothetical protein
MLNYGNIIVTGSGGTKEPFSGIKAPLDFRKAVHRATESISAQQAARYEMVFGQFEEEYLIRGAFTLR